MCQRAPFCRHPPIRGLAIRREQVLQKTNEMCAARVRRERRSAAKTIDRNTDRETGCKLLARRPRRGEAMPDAARQDEPSEWFGKSASSSSPRLQLLLSTMLSSEAFTSMFVSLVSFAFFFSTLILNLVQKKTLLRRKWWPSHSPRWTT